MSNWDNTKHYPEMRGDKHGRVRSSHQWTFNNCHLCLHCTVPNSLAIWFITFLWQISPCRGFTACDIPPNKWTWVTSQGELPLPSYTISWRAMGCSHECCCLRSRPRGKSCEKPWFPEGSRKEACPCNHGVLAWILFPKMYVHLEPVNKTLLENGVFADAIKLRWGHFGLEWELIQWLVSLWEEGNLGTNTHGRKLSVWWWKRRLAYTATSQGMPRLPAARRSKEGLSFELQEGAWLALLTCWFRRIHFCCFQLLSLC